MPSPPPTHIFGGGPSTTCEWPSTVFLENCTGTLIHPEIVVYAAHCGDDRERVWFGEDVSTGSVGIGQGFSVATEYCRVNPDFANSPAAESRSNDYAFCKLAEPVLDVPIVPPLYGCETTLLLSGSPVTLVGFGGTDSGLFAIKHEVVTELHYIDDYGVAVIGGEGLSPCAGDSGGPAFIQLPDGTWRAFGIVSGPNFGNCGSAMWFPTIYSAIPFIEEESGIDVTACHFAQTGQWNPSPGCGGFPLEPGDGTDKSWSDDCVGGPMSEPSTTCGPAFDASEDLVGPTTEIVTPEDRSRVDTRGGSDSVTVLAEAEITDAPSGVSWAELHVNGSVVDGSQLLSPPWAWNLAFPAGIWELHVEATDWAGNVSVSDPIVFGVDEDPPPAPEPSSSSGADESSSGGDDSTSSTGVPTTTTSSTSGTGDDESTGSAPSMGSGDDGCGCRSGARGSGAWLLFLLVARALRRRRGRVLLSLSALASCGDDGSGATIDTESTTSGSTSASTSASTSGPLPSTSEVDSSSSTQSDDTSTSSGDGSSTTSTCTPGTLDCHCTEAFSCEVGLACRLDTCVECEAGTLNCPCVFPEGERVGECDGILNCFGGLCVNPQPCPFLRNLSCDEPEGSGQCLEGTDEFDCCAVMPDVCEEKSAGGACPEGSDPDDCVASTDTDTETGSTTMGTDTGIETESTTTGATTTSGAAE